MIHRISLCVRVCVIVAVLALISGCGGRVNVSGKVIDKGQPISRAELRWASESDKTLFVSGVSDDTGKYILDAAGQRSIPPGRYRVTVTWWRMRNGSPLPSGEKGTALKGTPNAIMYTATLDVEVTKATDALDLDVTGKGQMMSTD